MAHADTHARGLVSLGGVLTTDKQPTPFRKRAHEPITLPPPMSFDQRIRRHIYEVLYHVLRSKERTTIDTLNYTEFVAMCERAIAEGEERND